MRKIRRFERIFNIGLATVKARQTKNIHQGHHMIMNHDPSNYDRIIVLYFLFGFHVVY